MGQDEASNKAKLAGDPPSWEHVDLGDRWSTYRLQVPGGWLYRFGTMVMCYVPDPRLAPTMPSSMPVPYEAGWSGVPGDGE